MGNDTLPVVLRGICSMDVHTNVKGATVVILTANSLASVYFGRPGNARVFIFRNFYRHSAGLRLASIRSEAAGAYLAR